jgi:copper chaperone
MGGMGRMHGAAAVLPAAGCFESVDEETVMATKTYTVTGMTCSHCVTAVGSEIRLIPGVTDVEVDLASGAVTVTSEQPIDDAAVAAAVDEAGYALAS